MPKRPAMPTKSLPAALDFAAALAHGETMAPTASAAFVFRVPVVGKDGETAQWYCPTIFRDFCQRDAQSRFVARFGVVDGVVIGSPSLVYTLTAEPL
jgi:hypothetical protein